MKLMVPASGLMTRLAGGKREKKKVKGMAAERSAGSCAGTAEPRGRITVVIKEERGGKRQMETHG